jgi:NitT/TauT family transport system permease protein
VGRTLLAGLRDHSLLIALATSGQRLLIGFGVSFLAGTVLGLLLGRLKWLEETIGSLIAGLQVLPSICWLPLALLWFGLSEGAILFVVVMGALLAITVAVESGVQNVPPLYLQQARAMGVNGVKLWWKVILPASQPAILTGAKLGWAFAWRSLMAGELLYAGLGLGQQLQLGRELNDMSLVLATIAVIVIVGLATDRLVFALLERRMRRVWGLSV